ncbi:MAG: hypothetical protein L0Y43_03175, partial [Methylococcaceae bacterium]|nr:hypothetical protein [Methylococcaceae bacterium]
SGQRAAISLKYCCRLPDFLSIAIAVAQRIERLDARSAAGWNSNHTDMHPFRTGTYVESEGFVHLMAHVMPIVFNRGYQPRQPHVPMHGCNSIDREVYYDV